MCFANGGGKHGEHDMYSLEINDEMLALQGCVCLWDCLAIGRSTHVCYVVFSLHCITDVTTESVDWTLITTLEYLAQLLQSS